MSRSEQEPSQSTARHVARITRDTALGYVKANPPFIGYPQELVRIGMEKAVTPFLNSEIRHKKRLTEAEEMLKSGRGLVIDANHISKRETFEIFRFLSSTPQMRQREVAILVAKHQEGPQVEIPNAMYHSKVLYIVTDQTKEEFAKQGKTISRREEAEMLISAMDGAVETLEHGGIVIVFGQGSRRPRLYDPKNTPSVYTLYNRARKNAREKGLGEPNFGIMTMGISVDPENYRDENFETFKRKINRKTKYVYDIGHTYPVEDYIARTNGQPTQLDGILLADIEELVDPEYIGEKPNQDLIL